MKRLSTKVSVVGLWHLGCVVAACLADLGYTVAGADKDGKRVKELNAGRPPLFEPGLAELVKKGLVDGRLTFTTDMKTGLKDAGFVYITYDTPVDEKDEIDLSEVMAAAEEMAGLLEKGTVIIVGSQVPVGTCERIKQTILQHNPTAEFEIAYVPENLKLGQAIRRFKKPDIIVIGTDSKATLKKVGEFFTSVIKAPIITMDLRSAEMTKHAINAFLATSISFSNEIANLCDFLGADALKVTEALSLDKRIGGNLPLRPGLGFAGGTLARDLKVLEKLWSVYDRKGHIIDAVLKVNNEQKNLVVRRLEKIYGSVACLDVGVLGLTYKAGTSTLRRSAALEIIAALIERGAVVTAYDPGAAAEEVKQHGEFIFCKDAYAAARDADALVIVTDWPEFKDLDFNLIKSMMRQPVIIDTRNMLDDRQLTAAGISYYGVGRGK